MEINLFKLIMKQAKFKNIWTINKNNNQLKIKIARKEGRKDKRIKIIKQMATIAMTMNKKMHRKQHILSQKIQIFHCLMPY